MVVVKVDKKAVVAPNNNSIRKKEQEKLEKYQDVKQHLDKDVWSEREREILGGISHLTIINLGL